LKTIIAIYKDIAKKTRYFCLMVLPALLVKLKGSIVKILAVIKEALVQWSQYILQEIWPPLALNLKRLISIKALAVLWDAVIQRCRWILKRIISALRLKLKGLLFTEKGQKIWALRLILKSWLSRKALTGLWVTVVKKRWWLLQKALPVFLMLLALYLLVISVSAFRASPAYSDEVPVETRSKELVYDYRVHKAPSSLYPEGKKLEPGEKEAYLNRILEQIQMVISGKIEAQPPLEEEGEMNLSFKLHSKGQWERPLDFNTTADKSTPGEETIHFEADFALPIAQAKDLAEEIEEDVGMRARNLNLMVKSYLESPPLAGKKEESRLTGEYKFELGDDFIKPQGELLHQSKETVTEEKVVANYISFLGIPAKVVNARMAFPLLLMFSVMGIVSIYCRYYRQQPLLDKKNREIQRINKRYGNRLVKINEINELPPEYAQVQVRSFKELVKLADEVERPIMHLTSEGMEGQKAWFYLIQEGTCYYYRISD